MPSHPFVSEQPCSRSETHPPSRTPILDIDGLRASVELLQRDAEVVFKTLGRANKTLSKESPLPNPILDLFENPSLSEEIDVADEIALDVLEENIIAETRATLRTLYENKKALDIITQADSATSAVELENEQFLQTIENLEPDEQAKKYIKH